MPRILPPGQQSSSLWVNVPVPQPVSSRPRQQQQPQQGQQQQQPAMPMTPQGPPTWTPPPLLILPHAPEADGVQGDLARGVQQFRRPIRFSLPEELHAMLRGMAHAPELNYHDQNEPTRRDYAGKIADRLHDDGLEQTAELVKRHYDIPRTHPMTILPRVRYSSRSPYHFAVSEPQGSVRFRLKADPRLVLTASGFEGAGGQPAYETHSSGYSVRTGERPGRPHFEVGLAWHHPETDTIHTLADLHTVDHRFVRKLVDEMDRQGQVYEPFNVEQAMAEHFKFRRFLRAHEHTPLRRPQLKLRRVGGRLVFAGDYASDLVRAHRALADNPHDRANWAYLADALHDAGLHHTAGMLTPLAHGAGEDRVLETGYTGGPAPSSAAQPRLADPDNPPPHPRTLPAFAPVVPKRDAMRWVSYVHPDAAGGLPPTFGAIPGQVGGLPLRYFQPHDIDRPHTFHLVRGTPGPDGQKWEGQPLGVFHVPQHMAAGVLAEMASAGATEPSQLARLLYNKTRGSGTTGGGPAYRPRKNRRWRYDEPEGSTTNATNPTAAPQAAGVALRRAGAPVRFAAGEGSPGALKPQAAGHDEHVKAVVADYVRRNAQKYGLIPYRDTPRRPVDEALSRRTADAFEAGPVVDQSPETQAAYGQLKREIKEQFDHIAAHGVRMEPWLQKGQPYKNSGEMFQDVRGNRHLWFFPTINPNELASFGKPGSALDPAVNPLVEASGHTVNGHPLTYNDLLRAVHDYAAHASVGNTFGPLGEYNAWAEHAKMFSPLAIKALTTETHGQNSWVNFGPHIRRADGSIPKEGDPDFVPQTKRPFADQKVFLLPEEAIPPHPYPELDHTLHQRQEPQRFAAYRAPSGGMVTRGIYEPGGRFVPPEATGQQPNRSRVRALVQRLLARRKRRTQGVIPNTSPGAGFPA
jgi:hypothetical protein